MKIASIQKLGEKSLIRFEHQGREATATLSRSAAGGAALALGNGTWSMTAGNLQVVGNEVSILGTLDFKGQIGPHEALMMGMKLWLSSGLDETTFRQANPYPELSIRPDDKIEEQLQLWHLLDQEVMVAVIPDGKIYLATAGLLRENQSIEFEHAGQSLLLRRNGGLLEFKGSGSRGEHEWTASHEEEQQIKAFIEEGISGTHRPQQVKLR